MTCLTDQPNDDNDDVTTGCTLPTPSKAPPRGRLVSQSVLRSRLADKPNWFERRRCTSARPSSSSMPRQKSRKPQRSKTPTMRSRKEDADDQAEFGSSDPAYYFLEIRLEHSSSLSGWTFRVIVTDTSVESHPVVLFSGMQCDKSNCIVFGDSKSTLRPTIFDPMQYFDHAKQPQDMYGHTLHIQVISDYPVQKTIVDTTVHFANANVAPPLTTEQVLDLLQVDKLHVDDKNGSVEVEPPPSTHDNSEYIYEHHFEQMLPTSSSNVEVADTIIMENEANLSDIDKKKRQLQRMRESMKVYGLELEYL
ncbi:hypothetical protein AC1031_013361 [Aphanomyces cochlioides]|nr:hypothetical protein AC1031_013361 [Aphanomyces cochlioides]